MRAGIKRVSQRQEVRIKVHPDDLLFSVSCKAHLLSCLDGEEDETVPPGSYRVESPAEIVDLRWDEQLDEVAAHLLEALTHTCQEVDA